MCTCARVSRCVYTRGEEACSPSLLPPPPASLALPSRSLEPELAEDPVQTQLHRLLNPDFYGYQDAPWRIFLRKEVRGAGAEGPRGPGRAEPGSG